MGNNYVGAFGGSSGAVPFLKWPGGKQWLAGRLAALIPEGARYFEPFLGGGSVFFARRPSVAYLSDQNAHLIQTFRAVKEAPQGVLRYLRSWRGTESTYYAIRASTFKSLTRSAARFIFLNRCCWNGVYRVNRVGQFNVPFGSIERAGTFDRRAITRASRVLERAELRTGDFQECLEDASAGDFVFLDPPYTAKHNKNGFVRYNEKLFTWGDQERLARVACSLMKRGCLVAVTNANHPSIVRLYGGFEVRVLLRHTSIAADSSRRGIASEVLLTSFPADLGRQYLSS